MFLRLVMLWMVAALAAPCTDANVTLVRVYQLRPPRDRHIVFAMAVMPNQDVISFIADKEGKWRLSRVHDWLEKEPHEDRTTVPGLVYGDREQWTTSWIPELLVTPDGRFVICIASAWRSEGRGQDEFISVVDLNLFQVVASIHTPVMPGLSGDYRTHHLDGRGNLVVQSYVPFPRHPGDDISAGGSHVKLALLSLPGLNVADGCEYSEWIRSGSPPWWEGEGSCATLLAREGGSGSLSDFQSGFLVTGEAVRKDQPPPPSSCSIFGYARYVSRDGRFEREVCLTSHKGFWGNIVVTKVVENIFSLRTGERIGSVNEPIDSLDSRFAAVDGREYLLLMEGGTRLTVYAIPD